MALLLIGHGNKTCVRACCVLEALKWWGAKRLMSCANGGHGVWWTRFRPE